MKRRAVWRSRRRRILSCALILLPSAVWGGATESCLEVVSEHSLGTELAWARDVRWTGESELAISAATTGVFRQALAEPAAPRLVARRGNGADEIWIAGSLAVSEGRFAVAAPVFSYGWGDLETGGLDQLHAMESILDLDLLGDRLLILGARRDAEKRFAPDGAIAWLGSLGELPESLSAVAYSKDGPGARSLAACGMMEIGAARFLPDGSFAIVPGVEPDVFVYDPTGRLVRTWSNEAVGLDAGCPLTAEQMRRLSADEPARWHWVNQRRTVDDLLPLREGLGVLVRQVRGGETHWQLKTLQADGEITSCDLPVSSASTLAHLKGDVAGERIVLLVTMNGYSRKKPLPELPPRLLTLRARER